MFLLVAEEYKSVDESETIRLLLEALNVCENVYGKNRSNRMVMKIYRQLCHTYLMIEDLKTFIKYSELLIKTIIDLHLLKPFHQRVSLIASQLMLLPVLALVFSVSINTVERAYEFLLPAQKEIASTDNSAKTIAARCFTWLGILFYTFGDLEKAETSVDMASQLFSEIRKSVERKKQPFEKTCQIMKEILLWKMISPLDYKLEISTSFLEELLASVVQEQEDTVVEEINSSDLTVDLLTKMLSQFDLTVEVDSFTNASLNPDSSNLEVKQLALRAHLDALEYNRKKGNVYQVAKIHASVEARELSLNENCSYDDVEKLISDAIRAKEDNDPSSCIRSLDMVLQLASNWKQKTKILKLRAECYLSRGDFRTAAINFNEAVRVYSNETVRHRDDLCEYLEFAVGLIKAEILCQNVAVAWYRYCVVATQLVSHREHEESAAPQVIELHYLGAKCWCILLEISESNYDELLYNLCKKVFLLFNNKQQGLDIKHLDIKNLDIKKLANENLDIENFDIEKMDIENLDIQNLGIENLDFEVPLLCVSVFRKFHAEEKAYELLETMEKRFINLAIVYESLIQEMCPKTCCRPFSALGRMLIEKGKIKQSIFWLLKSLWAFFSDALPDMLSFYEELLPLLQAITVTKSSGTRREGRSPFQQAVGMCKDVLVKQENDLNDVYEFLKTLADLYMALGRTEEAIVVAKTGLEILDFMGDKNDADRINNRARMLLYLAQMHQLNSSNSAFNREWELDLAEWYYKKDQDSIAEFVLQKNISYANFLCEQKRFAEADTVLQNMNNLDVALSNTYFSRVFYGPGIQKSIEVDGELLLSVEQCMYSTMVRVLVGIGKKRQAVAACKKLADNPVVVHDAIYGKRPSSIPYLVEACHRELLSLLSDRGQKRLQNCKFPLSPANVFELYYMLNEYSLALEYFPDETQSPELIEMRFSCLRLAGNELVELDRGDESYSYFMEFLKMLQTKEGFLDKPFHAQCATLAGYFFTNQYYIFYSLASIMASVGGNLDGVIQCCERCLELDEDFTLGQGVVAYLANLYQSKALTVDIENQDFCKRLMNLALVLFQKLLQKTAELEPFVEHSFGSLLLRLERYDEAVEHFENVINEAGYDEMYYEDVHKPLVDVYLRREIEASGRIGILVKVGAFYELILTYMKLNEVAKAQVAAFRLENYAECLKRVPEACPSLAIVGYVNKIIGKKQKAAEIFLSVLEIKPGHLPVAEALESLCL